jgi:hypothetical protein
VRTRAARAPEPAPPTADLQAPAAALSPAPVAAPLEPPPPPTPSPDDIVPGSGFRRTAMAELTALASTKGPDDFTPRRQR